MAVNEYLFQLRCAFCIIPELLVTMYNILVATDTEKPDKLVITRLHNQRYFIHNED